MGLVAAILAVPAGAQEELQRPSLAPPGPAWTLAGSLTAIVQNKSVLLQPALTFDRGPLHLESRYNSEDRDTFSLFLGWNLDYFSAWSGLTMSPLVWLQFGLALQRSRVIRTSREVQLGPQLGIAFWKMAATFSLYNPGFQGQYASLALAVTF
jgi:hypothetical protein